MIKRDGFFFFMTFALSLGVRRSPLSVKRYVLSVKSIFPKSGITYFYDSS